MDPSICCSLSPDQPFGGAFFLIGGPFGAFRPQGYRESRTLRRLVRTALFLLLRCSLAFLARLRKRDGDGLFATLHFAAPSTSPAFGFPTLVAVHLATDF